MTAASARSQTHAMFETPGSSDLPTAAAAAAAAAAAGTTPARLETGTGGQQPEQERKHQVEPGTLKDDDTYDYPDGGLEAWLVVLGAWCAMFAAMGVLNTLAVLQAWLQDHQLASLPESTVGWVLSTYGFFLYFCGAQIGPIFDAHDIKFLIVPGSIGMVASLICVSFSQEFYQFLLSFGFLGGVSAALLFNPAIAAVAHWFGPRRRALATGVACTAGGVGGVAFPLAVLYAGPALGFGWAVRVVALACAASLAVACALLRKRPPPPPPSGDEKKKKKSSNTNSDGGRETEKGRGLLSKLHCSSSSSSSSIDLGALVTDRPFALVTLAVFLVEFAVFIPYTYISSYAATAAGLPPQTAYRLNALLNVGAIPGRALPGYVADRFGVFNTMCATAAACVVFILGLWLPLSLGGRGGQEVDGEAAAAGVTAFTVLFGFWSGAAISLTPVCIAQVVCDGGGGGGSSSSSRSRVGDIGKRTGTAFFVTSFGTLTGVPIAGAILQAGAGGGGGGGASAGYPALIAFAGGAYAAALAAFVVARGYTYGFGMGVH